MVHFIAIEMLFAQTLHTLRATFTPTDESFTGKQPFASENQMDEPDNIYQKAKPRMLHVKPQMTAEFH